MPTKRRQRGANLVEFALIMVPLFLLVLGIAEFARAYNVYNILANAAREGARFAVAPQPGTSNLPTTAEIQARVQRFLDSGVIRQSTISVDPAVSKTFTGLTTPTTFTRVSVAAPYNFVLLPFTSITIRAQAEMRNETN